MLTEPECHIEKMKLLRFAATFVWADLELAPNEEAFMLALAKELSLDAFAARSLLSRPPRPDDVDPTRIDRALAVRVREVALRAIAADGKVDEREMELWDLLDELLPR